MKNTLRILCSVCLLIGLQIVTTSAAEEKLTNDSVIELHKLNLGDNVIVEKIKASPCEFDLSINALKKLKEAGISDVTIQAMIAASAPKPATPASAEAVPLGDPNDPKAPHPVGIYLFQEINGQPKMTTVKPSTIEKIHSSGGFFAIYGEKTSQKAQLAGEHAPLQISDGKPVFYFYFATTPGQESSDPADFALAEFEIKKDRGCRRLVIGKTGLYDRAQAGIDSKAVVNFSSEKIAPGIYKVVPATAMTNGEYCFLLSRGRSSATFTAMLGGGGELYCFGVQSGLLPAKKR